MSSVLNVRELMMMAPVIPVLVIDDVDQAVPLAAALCRGGLRVLEITLRSDSALASIETIAAQVPDAIVGAGTVNSAAQMQQIKEHGARFAVSPGFTHGLHEAACQHSMPWLPGICTPGEILAASECGYQQLKFFPASQSGGAPFLSALGGPFQGVEFCPTGGINRQTAADYLSLANVLCVGGSWVAPAAAVKAGEWEKIESLAREATQLSLSR